MKKIMINYSEDFRENKIASEIYSRLRNRGFDQISVATNYNVGLGMTEAEYLFNGGTFPEDSDLEKILEGIKVSFKICELKI